MKIPFQCSIESSDATKAVALEILIDNHRVFYDASVTATTVEFDIEDFDGERELAFVMSGKGADYTKVDESGNIVEDVVLVISNVQIDEIDISQFVFSRSTYTHNTNGSSKEITDKFFGTMGCNGRVSFHFTTPFYDWLLKNS